MRQVVSTEERLRRRLSTFPRRDGSSLLRTILLPILFVFALQCDEEREDPRRSILVGGIPVTVEISDTPRERWRGLMLREKLGWNEGMLFVFEEEDTLSFWMHKTSIPLSIAFMTGEGTIIDIQDMKPFDESTYRSRGVALYALEMNIGWFEVNGVEVGDKAFIEFD
jgi:uncharacterized membrane protein (UPF0127 family)